MIIRAFTLFLICLLTVLPAAAQSDRLTQLFDTLPGAQEDEWEAIEDEIWDLWSQSGSPAMDLLLMRGRAALAEDDTQAAIEHFTALVDHAPDFAEGWNARATAYFVAGMYGPSLADIRRTLALEPRHFGALSGLGVIFEELGDEQRALAAFRAVLAIHPHRPDVIEAVERLQLRVMGKAI